MAKVLFTVSYEIAESNRSAYMDLVGQLKQSLNTSGVSYSIYETENKRNHFQEVYIYSSQEAYNDSEDTDNPRANELLEKVYAMAKDKNVHYATLHEVA